MDWSKAIRDIIPIQYPLIEEEDNRVQIIFSENRYGMLLRPTKANRWCMYVLVDEQQAIHLESRRDEIQISYSAPAGRSVTWMGPTQKGTLKIPTTITADDFWVGMHLPVGLSQPVALARLYAFESKIRGTFDDNSSVRG